MIQKIGLIGRAYRHANRYLEIVEVLIKHCFADLISQSKLETAIDFGKKLIFKKKPVNKYSRNEHIRLTLEELGPSFVKFGQMMSNRSDLLPPELLLELVKLQSAVKPFCAQEARKIVESELGASIDELFSHFSTEPLAAGSIAQVHRATLFTGEQIVVKIQRPAIERCIETDVEIMFHLAQMIEKHVPDIKRFNLSVIVEEFGKAIRQELSFYHEAANIDRFASNFQRDERV